MKILSLEVAFKGTTSSSQPAGVKLEWEPGGFKEILVPMIGTLKFPDPLDGQSLPAGTRLRTTIEVPQTVGCTLTLELDE